MFHDQILQEDKEIYDMMIQEKMLQDKKLNDKRILLQVNTEGALIRVIESLY